MQLYPIAAVSKAYRKISLTLNWYFKHLIALLKITESPPCYAAVVSIHTSDFVRVYIRSPGLGRS